MVLRWIHKGWKAFWTVVLSLLLIVMVLGGGALIALQLDATKDIIAEKIKNDFRANYNGRLSIGGLEGTLPFNAELQNVVLTSGDDSTKADTLMQVKDVRVGIDIWALFQNKLSIDAFKLEQPSVHFLSNNEGGYTLAKALKKKKQPEEKNNDNGSSWIKTVEIIAPEVSIENGSFYIEKFYGTSDKVKLPEPFQVNNVNARMFVELTDVQRFVEMETFTAQMPNIKARKIAISGQIYNDNKSLEFNAFNFSAGSSQIRLNGTINGVDLYKAELRKQLTNAGYDINIVSDRMKLSEFTDVLTQLPDIDEPLDFSIQTTGTLQDLKLNTFRLGVDQSYFSINGEVNHLLKKRQLAYQFNIDTLALRKQDAEIFTGPLNAKQYHALEHLRLNGRTSGTADSLIVDVSGSSSLGSFKLNGNGDLVKPYHYEGELTGQGVDIGPLVGAGIDTTSLNFYANISGQNTSLKTGYMKFIGLAGNSFINHVPIDSLRLTTSLQQGNLKTEYYYRNQDQTINGQASANFNKKDPPVNLKGSTQNLDVAALFANAPMDSTSLNTSYEVNMQGTKPDRMQGIAQFEVEKSVINGDSVQAHQIKVQLDSPDLPSRTLQITSSLFDLQITGDLKPSNISNQSTYWSNYFKERIAREIKLDSAKYVPKHTAPLVEPLKIKGNFKARNLTLLKEYWPAFPSLVTNSTASFNVTADSSSLQFSSQIQSDTLRINTVQVKGAGSSFSGRFRHDSTLKQNGQLNFETEAVHIESDLVKMDSVNINLNYRQDSLYYAQRVKRFSKDARFNLKMRSKLSDANIKIAIDKFFLGNNKYAWQNEKTPQITYNRAKQFVFDSFKFHNKDEFFALKGKFSPDRSDSLQYIIHDVNLARISSLVKGRINFGGTLNGTLQTRSLTREPSVQGDLTVDRLQLQNRLVGDLKFSSQFNEAKDRFDTKLDIITDSTKYQRYLKANDGIGQNIVLDGYFKPADLDTKKDSVFYFDAHFNEIDMWIVQLITQNIFNDLEGRADGQGYISGNLQDVNYNADFHVHNVYARPNFLNTNYYLDGHVGFNRKDGVVLDNIGIKDKQGGTGSLNGSIDLNDFSPITYLDLKMKLNNLKFLDNDYDVDVPFYGSVAGTGNIRLSGDNTDMSLQTTSDIRVSRNSNLSIPLIAETELNSNNNFIKFVDSFENPGQKEVKRDVTKEGLTEDALQQAVRDLSFSERFNIDLQFAAPNPINVSLIFDPVTGEKLRAKGTGRLRITMNEGNVQMFGNYDVTGGSYQFVSGEIFSRKLDIRSGGSIVWEGPPDNARLDIDAVYHARPSVAALNGGNNSNDSESQRIPVNLIVEVTGTISSVENNYYFEVPNSFELNSNSTLQFTLNQINSDDQQKLLQATSILLTGNFLATGAGTSQTRQLSNDLRRSSTFINPLLSNQVISPLLSSQINSLLNSDVSQFDIDFKLNQYNQIDLGIALRLYNDKLILRREGYLTGGGSQNTFGERIGDLNATYRINNNLSLTAFHRQDQSYGTLTETNRRGDITPTVDGVGVEASVQFNTWQQFSHKVQNLFRRLLGKDEIDFGKRVQASEAEKNERENAEPKK